MANLKIPAPGKKWAKRKINTICLAVLSLVEKMTDKELRALIKTAGQFSTTNCGWLDYAVGPIITEVAKNQLKFNKNKRDDKRRKRGGRATA